MNRLGDFYQWDRSVYAQLGEMLCVSEEIRPAVIGFDILFSSQKEESTDMQFAQACKEHGNVITASNYVFKEQVTELEKGIVQENSMAVEETVMPYEALRNDLIITHIKKKAFCWRSIIRKAQPEVPQLDSGDQFCSSQQQEWQERQTFWLHC